MERIDGRRADELRKWSIVPNFLSHPAGSALISCGGTRVVCAVSSENRVPSWMKSQGKTGGWITCEYGMLPASTHDRMKREASSGKQGGRTVEIQRLIGRSLRMCADLEKMGENTFFVDCDVIDADGGTRCGGISGAAAALAMACRRLYPEASPFKQLVAAVSVGIIDGTPVLDLCYEEDSRAEVDMNVVMAESGEFIEIQGTAEHGTFSRNRMNELLDLAEHGLRQIFQLQRECIEAGLK